MSNAIVWFRNDLRIRDNLTLTKAIQNSESVVPVFILNSRLMDSEQFGSFRFGGHRLKFILESLHSLKTELQMRGSDLHFETGDPKELIPKLALNYNCSEVYVQSEIASEERFDEQSVEKGISEFAKLRRFWGGTLYHPEDLNFDVSETPDVFTEFRKRVEKYGKVRDEVAPPVRISSPSISQTQIPDMKDILKLHSYDPANGDMIFTGGEVEAWKRIKEYFWETRKILNYKETRNGLIGRDYSSKLSPWLSIGAVSPTSVYQEVKKIEKEVRSNSSTYWLIFELLWRDYFRFAHLKHGDAYFKRGGIEGGPTNSNPVDEEYLNAWKEGKTGIPFVDANMRELNQTGFMSNRGRQNVASFLAKDLKLDWRIGAAYFEEMLLDYDVYSNWGNWAYIAGVGNDPRKDRYFNVVSQAKRYDEGGAYVRKWVPELKEIPTSYIHEPWKYEWISGVSLPPYYKSPIVKLPNR